MGLHEVLVTTEAAISVACWLIVAAGATAAVFTTKIRDTPFERVGLAGIAITATGTACRIISQGWVSDGAMWLAIMFAYYVVVVALKHFGRSRPKKT